MKLIFSLFFLLLFLFLPPFTFAQTEWIITDFHSDISLQETGEVLIKEKIAVDFFSLEKHGIYRDIPYVYQDDTGKKTYTSITVGEVKQDNAKVTIETFTNDNNFRIRIGDPDKTISGKHTYEITYTASGVLRSFSEYDELYWNVTGQDWEADIQKASATVTLPKGKMEKVNCFEGYSGSTLMCSISNQTEQSVSFQATNPLYPSQGLTIAVGYTKGSVPILTIAPPKTIFDDLFTPVSFVAFLTTFLGGIGVLLNLWLRRGRDFWFRNRRLTTNEKEEVRPFFAFSPTLVEFSPPDSLRPAELGVLMDEKADTLDVTATLIDLASRGYLHITEIPKKWLFGSIDYELRKTSKANTSLLSYEKTLLNRLFSGGKETVLVSSLKKTFYDDLAVVKKELYEEVMKKKLFTSHPETTRHLYLAAGFIILFLGGFLIFSGVQMIKGSLAAAGGGIILSGILLLFLSNAMPRRSGYGREIYEKARGYKLFIGGAEIYRQQFFEKKNLFNEVLPYSIVFGLTAKFAKSMEEIGVAPKNPSWYTSSTHTFHPAVFASSVNSFSDSLSTAIASTPSSSGSSGGSSGGGFGGGGGGSW